MRHRNVHFSVDSFIEVSARADHSEYLPRLRFNGDNPLVRCVEVILHPRRVFFDHFFGFFLQLPVEGRNYTKSAQYFSSRYSRMKKTKCGALIPASRAFRNSTTSSAAPLYSSSVINFTSSILRSTSFCRSSRRSRWFPYGEYRVGAWGRAARYAACARSTSFASTPKKYWLASCTPNIVPP